VGRGGGLGQAADYPVTIVTQLYKISRVNFYKCGGYSD
jgi:hypothetical protein